MSPKITFGIIILNGEPFIPYNLRSIYPFAHEIIIVEGAYWASSSSATPTGHSLDNTLDELYKFKQKEDPRNIIQVITKDGLWKDLTEQCQAWTEKATGDYIWEIDIDEFYLHEDMDRIIKFLEDNPSISMMSFPLIQFCFGFDYVLHSGRDYFKHGIMECRRIFKFGPGYKYIQHEPPTVIDQNGVDLQKVKYINNKITASMGIYIYHYTAILKNQIELKAKAYSQRGWKGKSEYAINFFENWVSLKDPAHLGWEKKYYTWIEKFRRHHPKEINRLMDDIKAKKNVILLRHNGDVDKLLSSKTYAIKKIWFKLFERVRVKLESAILFTRLRIGKIIRRIKAK